jgi:FkbM family methyltransferase
MASEKLLLKIFKKKFAGRLKWQTLFTRIKFLTFRGLNFGDGASLMLSGELSLIKTTISEQSRAKANYVIFDVGASDGGYCDMLLQHLHGNPLIFSFEPSAVSFKKLKSKFQHHPNVHVQQLALSNVSGELRLYTDEPGSTIASLFPLERAFNSNGQLQNFEMVAVCTIDEFAAKHHIDNIDFLKLDTEGNELNVLLGASELLNSKRIKAIQFEFGTCNIDSRTYFRDFWNLLSHGYHIYRIVKNGLYPITAYTEFDEIFLTINYYAELK